jgi:hypothetical protein
LTSTAAERAQRALTAGRAASATVPLALALAALSLLQPWATTYDPWSWIVWGREVSHLDLQTTAGPSWKPLPVVFTTVFSLAGSAAPALWLVVARAGGLLSLAAAYAAGRRLGGRVAAIVAATALLLNVPYARVVWLGDSEGLLVAAVLLAIERHIAGAWRVAFVAGVAAALLRPETWPFLTLYSLWLAWRDPPARALVAAAWAGILVLWFAPELWGSGQLWRAAERARNPTDGAAAFAPDPALEVVRRARLMLVGPVKAAALVALLFALMRWPARSARTVLVLAGAAVLWVAMVAVMTTHGFSGSERYVMAPMAVVCVLAGVGAAEVAHAGASWLRRPGRLVNVAVGGSTVLLAAGAVPYAVATSHSLGSQLALLQYQADLRTGMKRAVALAGAREKVLACGQPATENYSVPMLAWYLRVHIVDIGIEPAPRGVVFQARPTPGAALDPRMHARRPSAFAGPVRVFASC